MIDLAGAADWIALDDPIEVAAISQAVTTQPVSLSDVDLAKISVFLQNLTDGVAVAGRLGIPQSVPSGLSIDR